MSPDSRGGYLISQVTSKAINDSFVSLQLEFGNVIMSSNILNYLLLNLNLNIVLPLTNSLLSETNIKFITW